MKTFNQSIDHTKTWYLLDATSKTLGRLAAIVSKYLTGKNNPEYTPFIDTGSYVVIINAEKICVTGKKLKDKKYYRYTGYQGGIKEISLEKQLLRSPELVIKHAISGMLPKGPLGRKMLTKLKVYAGSNHPHQAQNLETMILAN
ncbi:MAG: 50S ribosomal protein L13 [Coxiellaceae bacterium]|jgi:large subunit ribosomal protein L13|nr:50S ribosomal protein L13 [Coxiellaceae bacterium]